MPIIRRPVLSTKRAMALMRFRLGRSFLQAKDGMAAVEFAMILPILFTIFFGMLEGSDALTASRRVANATNSLADLVTQETEITVDEADDIIVGIARMVDLNNASDLTVKMASVTRDTGDPTKVLVEWSREWKNFNDSSGVITFSTAEPYTVGDAFTELKDDTVLRGGVSLIWVEFGYEYDNGISSRVFGQPITITRSGARWPRKSLRVALCTPTGDPEVYDCPADPIGGA